VKLHWSH